MEIFSTEQLSQRIFSFQNGHAFKKKLSDQFEKGLLFAVSFGHVTLIKFLFAHAFAEGQDVWKNSESLNSIVNAMLLAIDKNNKHLILSLIDANMNPNAWLGVYDSSCTPQNTYTTALHEAVKKNKCEATLALIKAKANLNSKDSNKDTPLWAALKTSDVYCTAEAALPILIHAGAYIHECTGKGNSPLHMAADGKVALALIQAGANFLQKNSQDQTPLSKARDENRWNVYEVLTKAQVFDESFLSKPLDFDKTFISNPLGSIPPELRDRALLIAFRNNLFPYFEVLHASGDLDGLGKLLQMAVVFNKPNVCQFLLEKGVNVNFQDDNGQTALQKAFSTQNLKLAALLIKAGACFKVNLQDHNNNGQSLLMMAIKMLSVELTKLLIECQGSLDLQDNEGKTALMMAKNFELAKILIHNGASLNLQEKYGKTALMIAIKERNFEIAKILVENGASVDLQEKYCGQTALMMAITERNFGFAQILVENAASLDLQETHGGKTALIMAVEMVADYFGGPSAREEERKWLLNLIQLLVKNGASLDVQTKNGRTALMLGNFYYVPYLVNEGYFWLHINHLAKSLIENGANVDHQDLKGKTPLMLTCSFTNPNIGLANLLIENGASLDVQDEDGETALIIAARNGTSREVIVKLLLAGACAGIQNKNGQTALTVAMAQRNIKVCLIICANRACNIVKLLGECRKGFRYRLI